MATFENRDNVLLATCVLTRQAAIRIVVANSECMHFQVAQIPGFLAAPEKGPCIDTAAWHVLGVTADTPRATARHTAAVRRAGQDGAPAAVAESFHGAEL